MAAAVTEERVLYLLTRSASAAVLLFCAPRILCCAVLNRWLVRVEDHAFELPWTPGFLHKQGGLVLSMGQFNQWVGSQLMASGLVQIWPGTPVAEPIFSGNAIRGIRLADQGVDLAERRRRAFWREWMSALR